MRKGSVTIGLIAAFVVALSLAFAFSAHAALFWEENFENNLTPSWDTTACGSPGPADGCNAVLSTITAKSGMKSLRSMYNFTCGMAFNGPGCGTYYDRYHPQATEVWSRWNVRFMNGEFNQQTGSKQMYNKGSGYVVIWHVFPGTTTLGAQTNHNNWNTNCPNGSFDAACNYYPNVGNVPLNDGQWHCVETRVVRGTPGVQNGIIQAWVDSTQVLNHSNVGIAPPGTGALDHVTHYTQMGNGERYVDDFAVGDTRIGCSGTTNNPPPAPPAGLTIR